MAITPPTEEAEAWAGEVTWSRSRSVCIRGKMAVGESLVGSPAASPPAHPSLDPGFQGSKNFLALQ